MVVSSVLLYAIVGAAVSVYFPFGAVAYGRFKMGYDPAAPRAKFDQLAPFAQRATWAHQNSFEVFLMFLAAALLAYVTNQTATWVAWVAIAFVVSRFLYSVFYIINWPVARSLMFAIGSLGNIALFWTSLRSLG